MPLLQITANDGVPRLFGSEASVTLALSSALSLSNGPITILVHGFKYAPGAGIDCPHIGLFAMKSRSPRPKVISWPRHLQTDGVTIGFGWQARGGLREVYGRAEDAGRALARLVGMLRRLDPARPMHILCHSMGARVALAALPHVEPGSVGRLLMLAAAEYRSVADRALQTPAGLQADVWHVTSSENDLYDFLFENLIPSPIPGDRAVGKAPLKGLSRLVLDDAATLDSLDRLGFRIAPPARRFCHWSPYLRGGVFGLYSALIRGDLGTDRLRRHLPHPEDRRWSRILPRLPATPLPIVADASV